MAVLWPVDALDLAERLLLTGSSPVEVRSSRFGAFRHRDFTVFWTGLFVSYTASRIQSVARDWLMYDLPHRR